jgi:hypothetical protein
MIEIQCTNLLVFELTWLECAISPIGVQEEMKAVASCIKRRGRMSISDLAMESNRLIDLEQKKSAAPVRPTACAMFISLFFFSPFLKKKKILFSRFMN